MSEVPTPEERELARLRRVEDAAREFLAAASLESMTKAPEYLAAKRALRTALVTEEAQPDHRVCRCGHTGSVHDPAEGAAVTHLGFAIEGVGRCRGSTDGGGRCPCLDFGRLMP